MAVFQGTGGGLTAAELADCSVFDQPNNILSADDIAALVARNDPQIHKVHDKMQAEVAKKLKRDQYRLQPAKMILTRAKALKERSSFIITSIQQYKRELVDLGTYSNNDINDLVDSKHNQLYKDMNDKLDLEFPCNEEAKK